MEMKGLNTTDCLAKGFGTKKAERNVSSNAIGFMETVAEKAAQDKIDYDEKAFASIGAKAPAEVKQAWMEAAKETGANGLGMSGAGKTNDLLGSTVQSAIRATEQALFDIDNPSPLESPKSMEVLRQYEKERAFYQSFLKKLNALT